MYILVLFFNLLASGCSTGNALNSKNDSSSYTVKNIPSSQNEYEGNLIVHVFNEVGKEINGATVSIYIKKNMTSSLNLKSTSLGIFNVDEDTGFTVKIIKNGFQLLETHTLVIKKNQSLNLNVKLKKL